MKGLLRKKSDGRFRIDGFQRFHSLLIEERILQELMGLADLYPEHQAGPRPLLLDLGCGKGPYAPVFAGRLDRIGLDVPLALEKGEDPQVAGAAEALPFRDETFDVIVLTEVLEHLERPELALAECARVLKPLGRLIVSVPFINPLHELPRDFLRFTPFALRALGARQGLRLIRLTEKGGLGGFLLLLLLYLLTRGLLVLQRLTHLPLIHRWNPFIFCGFVFPQRFYLGCSRPRCWVDSDALSLDAFKDDLSALTLGYIGVFRK